MNKIRNQVNFKYNISRKGFTIVETLVAVAILMISVAGPLVVATKGLTTALASKDQMIASYLAQDTMESIKNIRDNNLGVIPARAWLYGFNYPTNCNANTNACDVNGVDGIGDVVYCSSSPCIIPIYYNSSKGYSHNSSNGASQTIFSRHFYFESVSTNVGTSPEVRAHVYVDWKEGTVPYQIHLTSQLVSTTR